MATNTAMAVTGLILGLKPEPGISFQDAIITLYLLTMSWIIVIASLSSCNRLSDDTKVLQLASVIQSYAILAFAFAVLATADSFGSFPECNQNAVVVIFRPFSALKSGRIFGWIVVSLVFVCYTVMTVRDYTAKVLKRIRERKASRKKADPTLEHPAPQPIVTDFAPPVARQTVPIESRAPRRKETFYGDPRPLVDAALLFMLGFILLFWAFFVLNTELVIRWNQVAQNGSRLNWQFGQILAMFLTFLPFINMVTVFNRFGIKPTKQVEKVVKVSVIYDVVFDTCNAGNY
ncbi:hypothetical protein BYT27DRAFT_7148103 [Phlegmacium glaucopus]|nr:hypothetical protein BYT27DRAFT_7148103 [Phlegmacium glaucopus]